MLNRLNQLLDSWESRNRKSHWVSTVAKSLLTFGVAAGAVATAGEAEAAYCACSNPSCYGCDEVRSFSGAWYCNDSTQGCCTIKFTKDCYNDGYYAGHCGGTKYSYC